MTELSESDSALFEGLKSLSESAFPKQCSYCGRVYHSAEEFIDATDKLARGSGLKASRDDDNSAVIELYRNCICGSTLMDFFTDRRDSSPRGLKRRERFGQVMGMLEAKGMPAEQARHELLRVLRGGDSAALAAMGFVFRGQGQTPASKRRPAE